METPVAEDLMQAYVRRWFVSRETIVQRSGASAKDIDGLLTSGAAPSIVYSYSSNQGWWSALGAFVGKAPASPPKDGQHYFAPASLYWLRRGILSLRAGLSPAQAAAKNREVFSEQFLNALAAEPLSRANYPDAFSGNEVAPGPARLAAEREWQAWISGAYAVCLRTFTGQSCVMKESLARYLRTQFESEGPRDDALQIVDAMERLSVWLMPFSPEERPTGTPGIAIDNILARLSLGFDDPFAALATEADR